MFMMDKKYPRPNKQINKYKSINISKSARFFDKIFNFINTNTILKLINESKIAKRKFSITLFV